MENIAAADGVRLPLTSLSSEEQILRDSVRKFAQNKIAPLVREMDETQKIHPSLLPHMFEMGILGMETPEEYGGFGGSFLGSILAVEEISAVDPAIGVIVDVQNTLTVNALLRYGSEEQKKKYLPRTNTDTICSYALSEASSGSDAFSLKTQARLDGDTYVLNGRKLWISNAVEADLFIVFATVDPSAGYKGITAFIIERDMSGFQVGKKEDKLGIRASSTCELLLDDCRLPAANVLGEPGKGYKIAIETLNEGRIGIAAQMLGLAQGAWNHAAKYSQERQQFGKSIAQFQAVQFTLAEMATEIEAARLMVYNAARMKDAGVKFVKEAAMAKYFVSAVAERVASQAVEIFGGYGFVKDYPVEKLYRDAKIGKIYEGTSNMQLATIAKLILAG
ncbi:MAG TPA: acyl-CoA dehydrogenase [Acidobacteriaceae bacterium]|nr:acyl-CoA dehydrogenase [Acidobacteriaceae bacterium]